MTDIKLAFDNDLQAGDLVFQNNDIQTDDGLETAVYISIFTDMRVDDDEILPDPSSTDKRGFWGDQVLPYADGDRIGSKLWLLERGKADDNTMALAEQYIEECLQWLIEDGVALDVVVTVEKADREGSSSDLLFKVEIFRTVDNKVSFEFNYEWEET